MIKSTLYCLECREYVPLHLRDNHPCPSDKIAAVDKEMTGIVDRLYDMGITPTCAVWTATKQSDDEIEYLLTVQIEIESQVCQPVLGDLPTGWEYHWEKDASDKIKLNSIAYEEIWYDFGFDGESLQGRINELIKDFEGFLDTRDCDAVQALMLLSYW
ncbi:hypothetical protein V6C42_02175 [Pseudoclostridium thermosuccinogenes]|uniref:Uncharacterized protein n=1 Tax=Acetivibrio thermocellus (strain ATCC 27405 / DSM 1237 / JCM 9322 / NBRC 103400 / NCIMB 10682 / NRRL B-4536 / VPI 7372) TaxID=203119 RepID=A3DCT2_ACET2|nr:hypothetical protein [Acetivibrio thermocellus]ABN51761.1 hypothetical protein Cthe_0524 [Acetivibrio thermocellus ATCC 27405]MBZ4646908.1 hypothetical protein [Clostridia bacterium]MDI9467670.1 hypothetical protein [Bacillota bacterium]HBW26926.1 hypothetical protein [Acetivibrio thermocellus]